MCVFHVLAVLVSHSLCTETVSTDDSTIAVSRAGESRVARQVYSPPSENWREAKVKVRVVVLPTVTGLPTVILSPLVMTPQDFIHWRVGVLVRPSIISVTVQIKVYISPTLELPSADMKTSMAGAGTGGEVNTIQI